MNTEIEQLNKCVTNSVHQDSCCWSKRLQISKEGGYNDPWSNGLELETSV